MTDVISYSWGGAIETDFISVIRGCDEIHFYSLSDGLILAEILAFTDNASWDNEKNHFVPPRSVCAGVESTYKFLYLESKLTESHHTH